MRFLLNPVKFLPSATDATHVGAVRCERTSLQGDAGKQYATGTGKTEELKADMVSSTMLCMPLFADMIVGKGICFICSK